jgi:exodeoxyribonuclease VII small subunit
MKKKTPKSYDEAWSELDLLVRDLESEDTSIDQLTEKVSRANFLVEFCKNKLRAIESSINGESKQK